LDKDRLNFDLNPADFPDSVNGYGKSDCSINAKNLTDKYIAIRVKTTKKEVYTLNPTFSLVKPNESIDIKFTYIIKDLQEFADKHKFKFEGIIIPEEYTTKEIKAIFDLITKNKLPVRGCTIKLGVTFNNLKLSRTALSQNKPRDLDINRSLNLNNAMYENIKEDE
jgi:hypothetical protein